MGTEKSIMKVVPGVMSVAIVSESLKFLPTKKELEGKKKVKSNKQSKKIIKGFAKIMIGVPLIKGTAAMINKI